MSKSSTELYTLILTNRPAYYKNFDEGKELIMFTDDILDCYTFSSKQNAIWSIDYILEARMPKRKKFKYFFDGYPECITEESADILIASNIFEDYLKADIKLDRLKRVIR